MAFFHACAAWSTTCIALGHMAVAWALQNFIPGERAPLLTVQVRGSPPRPKGRRPPAGRARRHAVLRGVLRLEPL
jgi:hypothetical protein